MSTAKKKKKEVDIKTLKIPNICFSTDDCKGPQSKFLKEQRVKRGFDDTETIQLDNTISAFIIPRLERYIHLQEKMKKNSKKEQKQFIKLLEGFKLVNTTEFINSEQEVMIKKKLKNFNKLILKLCW